MNTVKNDIIDKADLIEVRTEGDSGLILCKNKSETMFAYFADMGDGNYFNVSGWTKPKSKYRNHD